MATKELISEISKEIIRELFLILEKSKSPDSDGLHPQLLKELVPVIELVVAWLRRK